MNSADYERMLENLRAEISTRLFEEAAALTAGEVTWLVQTLNEIDQRVSQMADNGDSCSGTAPDFSSVTAVVNWSVELDKWEISCSVASDSE